MMSGIRGRDTRPELRVRRYLHSRGFRYRLHAKGLPGRPDLVFPGRKTAVFVHGCFWHRHESCRFAATPATNADFWRAKFQENIDRDRRKATQLVQQGWRVEVVWECDSDDRLERLVGTLTSAGSDT
jgi:DNA mismatch endonuclease (patch repair protein)